MRYLHYIIDENGNQIETNYSASNVFKISMISLARITKGEYKVWDKETNEKKTFNYGIDFKQNKRKFWN